MIDTQQKVRTSPADRLLDRWGVLPSLREACQALVDDLRDEVRTRRIVISIDENAPATIVERIKRFAGAYSTLARVDYDRGDLIVTLRKAAAAGKEVLRG